jgi:hypothetical protein
MISINVRPSSVITVRGLVPPQSLTAAAASSAWIDAALDHKHGIAVLLGSVATGGTMTITAEQSAASDGSSPKALNINGAASVAYADTTDNTAAVLDLEPLDIENSFRWIRVTATATGAGDAVLIGCALLGVGPKHETGLNPSTT